jgi:hypothetical protein
LTLPIFKEDEEQNTIQLIQKFLKDQNSPITKEKYLEVQKQLGKEPDPKYMPLGYEDLPEDAQLALIIYNKLGNRIYGDVGFTGKDYTNLPILIERHNIYDTALLIDLLNVIDIYYIEKNQKQIKKMYDDMKKKTK